MRQEKDTPYLLQRSTSDALVLPHKYLPELRMLPGSKLNASEGLIATVLGHYSGMGIYLKDRQMHEIGRVQLTKTLRGVFLQHFHGHTTDRFQLRWCLAFPTKSTKSSQKDSRSARRRSLPRSKSRTFSLISCYALHSSPSSD